MIKRSIIEKIAEAEYDKLFAKKYNNRGHGREQQKNKKNKKVVIVLESKLPTAPENNLKSLC